MKRVLVKTSAFIVAPLLFLVGLISPLTPSVGLPSLVEIAFFWLIPLLIIAFAAYQLGKPLTRIALGILFVSIFCFETYLFCIQI